MYSCTADRRWAGGRWSHRGCHVTAAPGEQAGKMDSSGGGSDCRESRCSEPDEYRGDLREEDDRKGGGMVDFYHSHWKLHKKSVQLNTIQLYNNFSLINVPIITDIKQIKLSRLKGTRLLLYRQHENSHHHHLYSLFSVTTLRKLCDFF